MADETNTALEDLLRKAQMSDDVDFLREGVLADLAESRLWGWSSERERG